MSENKLVMKTPKIRFKGYSTDWQSSTLKDWLKSSKTRNVDLIYDKNDVLSVSGEFGVVNQIQFHGKSSAGVSVKNYGVVNTGDVVYTKSPLRKQPYGIIKSNKGQSGIVSTLYAIYNCTDKVSAEFVEEYFNDDKRLNDYLRPLVRKGAKNDMKVSSDSALEGFVTFPHKSEQVLIANFLCQISKQINLLNNKIECLSNLKQTMLLQMFPQKGESVPEVRFKGFEDKWKKTPLKSFAHKCIKKNTNREYDETFTNSAELGVISQKDYFDYSISNEDSINGYYIIEPDDFVYNPRISTSAPVGPINRNLLNRAGIMSPLYFIFSVTGIDKSYLSYFFKTNLWHKFMFLNGNTGARFDRLSITDEMFLEMPICTPPSLEEQQKIAAYFVNLDKQISLQTQRLEKLKQIKSACLDKMFV